MMKLSTMHEVVATVDDQWESPLADALLSCWEHGTQRPKYWRASANFVFFFRKAEQDYVLRFNHASERTRAYVQAEIDFVNHLAVEGIRVARPVQSKSDNFVESVPTDYGVFHAVVFESLQGVQQELVDLSPEQFTRWGQALGELHNVTPRHPIADRPTWEDHLTMITDAIPADEKAARQTLDRVQRELSQLPIHDHNFGLIHYDFELDNVVWQVEQPGIIDFDDSAWYWFVADIAYALRGLYDDSPAKVNLNNASFMRFIEGYRSARQIEPAELQTIPLFLSLHNLVSFAKVQRALTTVNPTGEPEWLTGLRNKLAAKLQFYRGEFSA